MNKWDVILTVIIAVAFILVMRYVFSKKSKKKGCCGNCDGCNGCSGSQNGM